MMMEKTCCCMFNDDMRARAFETGPGGQTYTKRAFLQIGGSSQQGRQAHSSLLVETSPLLSLSWTCLSSLPPSPSPHKTPQNRQNCIPNGSFLPSCSGLSQTGLYLCPSPPPPHAPACLPLPIPLYPNTTPGRLVGWDRISSFQTGKLGVATS